MAVKVTARDATLEYERELASTGARYIAGMDEVGRGALAGPVTVGIVIVDAQNRQELPGLRDSKLLSPARRVSLVPMIEGWALARGIGSATAVEIDRHGILQALRLAGERAFESLGMTPHMLILDGKHDWSASSKISCPVLTKTSADRLCASVAAASVLAKVYRDEYMQKIDTDHPEYGWSQNKGYGTAAHREAIDQYGPSGYHRKTWRISSPASVARNTPGE